MLLYFLPMMNLVLQPGETSYLLSALYLALVFGTFLLFLKLMTVIWLNDTILFGRSPDPSTYIKIPKVTMMTVNIPFTFNIKEDSKSTYHGVHCIISSQVRYRLEAFWGVNIKDLHFFLQRPWNYGNITSLLQSPLNGHFQQVSNIIRDDCHDPKLLTLELWESLNLGSPPRQYYPLVVFLMRDSSDELLPDETVALINIVHICDDVCTLPTSILAQYLKQANGRLTCLKQLYIASEKSLNYESGTDKSDVNEPLCVVCQVFLISCVLLPCRHTCICFVCFNKLKACPLCRSPIKSYFIIRNEECYTENEKLPSSNNNRTFSQWFQDKITDFLGFER